MKRITDEYIARMAGHVYEMRDGVQWRVHPTGFSNTERIPKYTTDLNAIVGLIEGEKPDFWSVERTFSEFGKVCYVAWFDKNSLECEAEKETPALALCHAYASYKESIRAQARASKRRGK